MKPESPFYQESLAALSGSQIFAGVEEGELKEILSAFSRRTWQKHATISPEHNMEWFHFIVKGKLEVSNINVDSGKEISIFIYSESDVFDLLTFLQNRKHEIISTALEDLECLIVPMHVAREWLSKYPKLNQNFLPYIGKQLYKLEMMTSDLALHDTTTRLAKLILRNSEKKTNATAEYPVRLINNLSHEQIAKMIGSVRVVVNRSIQKLKSDGIISTKRNSLIIKDLEKLKKNYSQHF